MLSAALVDVEARQQVQRHQSKLQEQLVQLFQQCEASIGVHAHSPCISSPMKMNVLVEEQDSFSLLTNQPKVQAAALKDFSGMTNGIISTSLDMPWKIALVEDEQSSTNDGEESIQCIDDSESDDQSLHHHELSDAKTTLMVRNIPVLYTQEMLLEEWPSDGSWDFLYLPRSNSGAGRFNLTYAFINSPVGGPL